MTPNLSRLIVWNSFLLLSTCSVPQSSGHRETKHRPEMTSGQVIDIAQKDAIAHGYNLAMYQHPEAEFESSDRPFTWIVDFGHKTAGQYLVVVIDEDTGERGFRDESGWHPYKP